MSFNTMGSFKSALLSTATLAGFLSMKADAHGALTTPPSRAALCGWSGCSTEWNAANKGPQNGPWGSDTPICGGTDLINKQDIQASYTGGQVVSLGVSTTARHMGYYEFRLCVPNGDVPETNSELMDCVLSGPLLKRARPLQPGEQSTYKGTTPVWTQENLETRWRQEPEDGVQSGSFLGGQTYYLDYIIPDIDCEHCVLHFYWQSLNSWQSGSADSIGTTSGERFWNCADISISSSNGSGGGGSVATPNPTPNPTIAIPTNAPTTGTTGPMPECVSHDDLMAINDVSSFWPKCDPFQSKTVVGPAGYEYGYYCDSEWVAELNKVLVTLGYCDNKEIIVKFLAQIAYETAYYSTLGQPIDNGSGLIHMIPANWEANANDMEALFPGEGLLQAFFDYPVTKDFFKQPQYAWKSAAAWMKRTNRVIPGCGKDLFTESFDEQTRCILGRVNDRSEPFNIVDRIMNEDGGFPTTPTAAPTTAQTAPPVTAPTQPPVTESTPAPTPASTGGDCAPVWAKCGGNGHTGPTCCTSGNRCDRQSEWYSQCVPGSSEQTQPEPTGAPTTAQTAPPVTIPTQPPTQPPVTESTPAPTPASTGEACAPVWAKCGGNGFTGPTCCTSGNRCNRQSEWYSQCVPE